MNARLIFLGILTLFAGTSARADYAWIPGYQKLVTKAGIDVLVSESNFESSGTAQALPANGQLKDAIFWLSAEYGLVESWSVGVELPFYFSSLVSNTSSLQGTGLGDTTLRLKWSAKLVNPFFTPELMLKFPTGDSGGTGGLAIGEGNFDLGFFLHMGHRSEALLFSFSPGLLARFGGYSSAVAGEIALQYQFSRGYARAFAVGIFSFEDSAGLDSTTSVHDAPGAGGSYARLNSSPMGMSLGGKLGLNLSKQTSLEFGLTKALFGSRYPNYFKAGGDIAIEFDFFEAPKAMKVKEVPFNYDYDKD